MKQERRTYVSGEVPGLLGAGFAEAASLPDSTKQKLVKKHKPPFSICESLT